ncbi:MAG: class I SAM-dependent methyltransferase [Thermodesulfobacteriota bacterium]
MTRLRSTDRSPSLPRLYRDLASWFPLLTPPGDYAEEAGIYREAFFALTAPRRPHTLLELGSGGGHNASHLKAWFEVTLVDLSPEMLEVSRALNPECAHVAGDMRTVRLGRQFDAVFLQDAVGYLTTAEDLRAAARTAFAHCAPGGAALFCPDFVRESFRPGTEHGGSDEPGGSGRGLRYLEWVWDPDPGDDTYLADMAYLLRHADGTLEAVADRHVLGLFPRATWAQAITAAGFGFEARPFAHSTLPSGAHELFAGRRAAQGNS